jgi:hypothetical protein
MTNFLISPDDFLQGNRSGCHPVNEASVCPSYNHSPLDDFSGEARRGSVNIDMLIDPPFPIRERHISNRERVKQARHDEKLEFGSRKSEVNVHMSGILRPSGTRLPAVASCEGGSLALEVSSTSIHHPSVSKVEQMEVELRKLSQTELCQIREWLDDMIEDQLPFTPEFEHSIQQAERDMAEGKSARVREPAVT